VAGGGMAVALGGKIFKQRVAECEDFDQVVLDDSGTVMSQGFEGYMHLLEIRTGRRRTEEDRAMRYSGSKRQRQKIAGKRPK
jgi:hypothetical protein